METLEERRQEEVIRNNLRNPLWEVRNNLTEIRTISEETAKYAHILRPAIPEVAVWEALPRIVSEFMLSCCAWLASKKSTKENVSLVIGDLLEMGIEYGEFTEASKVGTLNPLIHVRKELNYEYKDIPYDDLLSTDMAATLQEEGMPEILPQFFDSRDIMKTLCEQTAARCKNNYGITFFDWTMVLVFVTAFFRKTKEYLIAHKDDGEYGLSINLGEIIYMDIEKYGTDDNPGYTISFRPGKKFKQEFAKSDKQTEEGGD